MELTQRLECTQTVLTEKLCPEQVAILGICGRKFAVNKGPNKIGRDPETCSIALHSNSISRQHAVINILNNSECMLMDLDSANKTKLENKTLEPYIPYPLRNGDIVQLGDIFGTFRLLEDDNDLPMTQAIDIPDTPIPTRHISKLNNVHITTVPESPDISDRDDSFIVPSQPKMKEAFKSPNNCVKSLGKAIQQIGNKKIDNVYWNSSRKSDSFNLQSPSINSLNGSLTPLKTSEVKIGSDNIHELNTQIPSELELNEHTDSLFTAATQIPERNHSLNIYEMETQVSKSDILPTVCRIEDQENLQVNFFANKEGDNNIFHAETQVVKMDEENNTIRDSTEIKLQNDNSKDLNETSNNDIILFDEIESQVIDGVFGSQPLLPSEETGLRNTTQSNGKKECTQSARLKSDSSTDCEDFDFRISQNVCDNQSDGDITDCEDVPECNFSINDKNQKPNEDDDVTDCEDELNDHINEKNLNINPVRTSNNFEDLPTQIIKEDHVIDIISKNNIDQEENINFEDMLTQVIAPNNIDSNVGNLHSNDIQPQIIDEKENTYAEKNRQLNVNPFVTPFKIPQSPFKIKKDKSIILMKQQISLPSKSTGEDDKYYALTQDIVDDLCSQVDPKLGHEINNQSTTIVKTTSVVDIDEKIDKFVLGLSSKKNSSTFVNEIKNPDKIKVQDRDSSSDIEVTPKKTRALTFMEIDLPNSQEIKNNVTRNNTNTVTELTSESETENDSEHSTPILFRNKKKKGDETKQDLKKMFDINTLPSRVITRVRKPTSKILSDTAVTNSTYKNIFKPVFLIDQEENIDKDIITENISRLKNTAKSHTNKNNKVKEKSKDEKKDMDKNSNKVKKDREKQSNKKKEKESQNNSKKIKLVTSTTIDSYMINTNLDTSLPSSRTTRSRSRKKNDKDDDIRNKSSDKNNSKSEKNNISNPRYKKETQCLPDHTIRRSRRQKNEISHLVYDKLSKQVHHEQSAVYNMSSESSMDTANIGKRSAERDLEIPNSKKMRTSSKMRNISSLRSSSASRANVTHHVLFTAFPNASHLDIVKSKLEKLGAVMETDVMNCTVVLTLQIKRTFKLLCAVGLGRPIVGPKWVEACADANCIVDPKQYILKDSATEQRFQFNLETTLGGKRNFLRGYKISCTPKVMPNAEEMKMIVECSGGTWKEGGRNWLCVSCLGDKSLWPQLRRKGATVVSTELILGGVLRQQLDIDNNRLV